MNMSQTIDDHIENVPFSDIPMDDPFLDSLRDSYPTFDDWMRRKSAAGERAWISRNRKTGQLQAMLYLKNEEDVDDSCEPILRKPRVKIGTFKVDFDHHTSLGKRLLAIALRHFAESGRPYVYVTMHDTPNTQSLMSMLREYGFDRIGSKGEEQVWAKRRPIEMANDPHRTFPFIDPERDRAALLAIKPEYHALMFGDNRLRSEAGMPVEDEIPTNTIEKVYLSGAPAAARLEPGDRVVIYRTGDGMGPAEYRAVVSAVCTITETRHIDTFGSRDDFLDHLKGRSVFRADELDNFWGNKRFPWVISMLYNFPLKRRPTRHELLDKHVIARNTRLVCERITAAQFKAILELGEADEGYAVDQA